MTEFIITCQSELQKDGSYKIERHRELIRCENCKYHYVDGDNVRFNMCLLNHNKVQPDDWFCADGER